MPILPELPKQVSIREVGPRDGLQHEDVILATAQKITLIDALAHTGIGQIEVGSFVRAQNVPQMADTAEVFAAITRRPGVTYSDEASTTRWASEAGMFGATAAILLPVMATSRMPSMLFFGSITWPPLRRRSYRGWANATAARKRT